MLQIKNLSITHKKDLRVILNDFSCVLNDGDKAVIIGEEGNGKSTLLKACCGILKPYKGSVTTKGTIAPLIELGAGFDMNMTARENVFLNGTVLGHSRKFMDEHFEEIIEFAVLQDFLDGPIKNFSSGMQARLGFAIATMVRPDILVVDEILSVGDYQFLQKCYERQGQLLSGCNTLLYVSHDINSVRQLCDHAIWIDKGNVRMSGLVEEVTTEYMHMNQ